MLLSLCLLLPVLSPSSQEICSAPGTLLAPILYLSQTSAQLGDSVQFQCSVFSQVPATHVIFCKDGKKVASQRGSEEKVIYIYNHAISGGSSGHYTCGYEIKDNNNQMNRSQLSPAQHMSVTGKGSPPNLVLGIMIPAILVLAVALYLLVRKGYVSIFLTTLSHCLPVAFLSRNPREPVQHDTSNAPEDHIEYASVNLPRSAKHPQPHTEETTYATITAKQNRRH